MIPKSLRDSAFYARLRDWRYLWRQRARRRFYSAYVPPGALVFDVGANVGHYTLLFNSLGARVVAVEPQASLAARLATRFARKGNHVVIENCALGAEHGEALLYKTDDLTEVASLRTDIAQTSRFAAEHPFVNTERVPVSTLEALVARHGKPDFCKIDVEGFEREVIAGLRSPIRSISFEFNREYLDVASDCLALLERLAPYRFNYAIGEQCALASSTWLDAAALRSALHAMPDPLLWGDIYARLPA